MSISRREIFALGVGAAVLASGVRVAPEPAVAAAPELTSLLGVGCLYPGDIISIEGLAQTFVVRSVRSREVRIEVI